MSTQEIVYLLPPFHEKKAVQTILPFWGAFIKKPDEHLCETVCVTIHVSALASNGLKRVTSKLEHQECFPYAAHSFSRNGGSI